MKLKTKIKRGFGIFILYEVFTFLLCGVSRGHKCDVPLNVAEAHAMSIFVLLVIASVIGLTALVIWLFASE